MRLLSMGVCFPWRSSLNRYLSAGFMWSLQGLFSEWMQPMLYCETSGWENRVNQATAKSACNGLFFPTISSWPSTSFVHLKMYWTIQGDMLTVAEEMGSLGSLDGPGHLLCSSCACQWGVFGAPAEGQLWTQSWVWLSFNSVTQTLVSEVPEHILVPPEGQG